MAVYNPAMPKVNGCHAHSAKPAERIIASKALDGGNFPTEAGR
jgi:hypothetical protein